MTDLLALVKAHNVALYDLAQAQARREEAANQMAAVDQAESERQHAAHALGVQLATVRRELLSAMGSEEGASNERREALAEEYTALQKKFDKEHRGVSDEKLRNKVASEFGTANKLVKEAQERVSATAEKVRDAMKFAEQFVEDKSKSASE